MSKIKLNEEERKALADLYRKAQTTPVIFFGDYKDMATIAWNSVRKFMDKLGEKYDFVPSIYSINSKTGEIKKYSEVDFENIKYRSGRRF